jgi:phosphoenolpyruvate synthase/pyruvate phosphate dikinase
MNHAVKSGTARPAGRGATKGGGDAVRGHIDALNRALLAAYGPGGTPELHKPALRFYLRTMTVLNRELGWFSIANNRIFRAGERLVVPYETHGQLSIHILDGQPDPVVRTRRLIHGTLVTDAFIAELSGLEGRPVDLEREIYHFEVEDVPAIPLTRLRDLARLLARLNTSGSRHEAVYLLRFLVARLCSTSYKGVPGAKNLQNEINQVRAELARFMNGPFADRMRLPARILVRSISGLVSRPKLIDEVWQDTIDLSEVLVRGSSIANEIRRSTHHAIGKHTLLLAQAYLEWLQTGAVMFPDPQRTIPSEADSAARSNPAVLELVRRIVSSLEQLLGSSQIAQRLDEWRLAYREDLMRCASANSLDDELESLVVNGIRAGNRWVYQHRLRSLGSKLREGDWPADASAGFEASLARLGETLPGEAGFDADRVASEARAAVRAFGDALCAAHQDALFASLDDLLDLYRNENQFQAFEACCRLRRNLERMVGNGVFENQRYLLHQLDCLLEEMGFFALRHVASGYAENGLRLPEALRITHLCAGNLERDGLSSRELWDLTAMLVNPVRTVSELLDVLEQIQRNYHRLVHRVSAAYEVMAEHLGYGREEMRGVLANFQRTMHDLNSLVHFSDLVRTHLSEHGGSLKLPGSGAQGEDPWDIIHLSDRGEIGRRIADREAVSLQSRYGGKGSGLLYISHLGIPTRDGFIIPTVLARLGLHRSESDRFEREVLQHLRRLEADIERHEGVAHRLGDPRAPLLLAVRGGSVFSMPGMLATMVFVGMTEPVVAALAREDEWYAWDACRRFLASFSAAVWDLDLESLDLVENAKRRHGVALKTDLPGSVMREVVESSMAAIRESGHGAELDAIFNNAELQLLTALRAVHASWDGHRARRYRAIKHLSDGWHTAITVQQMASGNRTNEQEMAPGMDEMSISLTGVIPNTRMQSTGFRAFTGDVKFSACGDDLVGGVTAARSFEPVQRLQSLAPMLDRRLNHFSDRLRRFLGSDAEIEFTVERGILSVLQARSAEVESKARLRTFDQPGPPAGRGIGIGGGAFRGLAAFDEQDVERLNSLARDRDDVDGVLLVLENPIPDEIPLILSVDGLLAAHGGSTSHAAVAVHGIGDRPYSCVLGVPELSVRGGLATLAGGDGKPVHSIRAGDLLSIHGQTGEVFVGARRLLDIETATASEKDT